MNNNNRFDSFEFDRMIRSYIKKYSLIYASNQMNCTIFKIFYFNYIDIALKSRYERLFISLYHLNGNYYEFKWDKDIDYFIKIVEDWYHGTIHIFGNFYKSKYITLSDVPTDDEKNIVKLFMEAIINNRKHLGIKYGLK